MSQDTQNKVLLTEFRLGDWQVLPSQNRIVADGRVEEVEGKTMDVLVYLASRAGEVVSNDELIQAVWGGRPMGENPVYKCVANARKALGDDPKSPIYIETIARRGYRLVAEVSQPSSAAPQRRRWVAGVGAIAVLLLIASWLWPAGISVDIESANDSPTAIAVIPFENLSDDQANAYVGSGIAEEILNLLAGVDTLRVVARGSSFSRGTQIDDIPGFLSDVGAQYFLSGSIQRHENMVRVRARLVDATGGVLWSESFDREASRIFDVQNAIAAAVVAGLPIEAELPAASGLIGTQSFDAYAAYLAGRQHMHRRIGNWKPRAVAAYRQSIELDPQFAHPYAGLASALLINTSTVNLDIDEAQASIDRALALNPNLAEAHAAAGLMAMGDASEASQRTAITLLRRAIELNPSLIDARNWLAIAHGTLGETEAALLVQEQALALDPLNSTMNMNHGRSLNAAGFVERAREQMVHALTLPDSALWEIFWLADLERSIGDGEAAIRWLRDADAAGRFDDDGLNWYAGEVAHYYVYLGLFSQAESWLRASAMPPETLWWINSRWSVYSAQNRTAELGRLVDEHLAAQPPDEEPRLMSRSIHAWYAERVGDYGRVVDTLAPVFDDGWSLVNSPGGRDVQIETAQVLAVSLLELGREADAQRLLNRTLEIQLTARDGKARVLGESVYREAVTHMLLGNDDVALEYLQQAVEAGWRGYYPRVGSTLLSRMSALPGAESLMRRVIDDLDAQAMRVIAIDREANFRPPAEVTE
ncbi:MAG: winged helix-turn-helix domain-containing protein [Pseudomonadota bacterium]